MFTKFLALAGPTAQYSPDASKKNGSAPLLDARCDIAAMFLAKRWTQPMDRAARD
jgi:hypothetical protein